MTYSGILFYTECDGYELKYDISSYFDKDESWVKLDFDITELYARKLKEQLSGETFYCGEEERFNRLVDEFLANWESEQHNYDLETHYSNKHDEQHAWEAKISSALAEHDHTHDEHVHGEFVNGE